MSPENIAWSVGLVTAVIIAFYVGYYRGYEGACFVHRMEAEDVATPGYPWTASAPIPKEHETVIEVTRFTDPTIGPLVRRVTPNTDERGRVRVTKPEPEPPMRGDDTRGKIIGNMVVARHSCGCEMASMWKGDVEPAVVAQTINEWRGRGAKIFHIQRREGDPVPPLLCPMHSGQDWKGQDPWSAAP